MFLSSIRSKQGVDDFSLSLCILLIALLFPYGLRPISTFALLNRSEWRGLELRLGAPATLYTLYGGKLSKIPPKGRLEKKHCICKKKVAKSFSRNVQN